jgi:hypothetical protein
MAWDAHGERLAVAIRSVAEDGVSIVLYWTATQPVLTARYIGRIERGPSKEHAGQQSPADSSDSPDRVALAFQPGFQGGSLLAARCGDALRAVPMYFEPMCARTS